MQDAQGLKGAKLDQLAPILQELLEDGEVRDSVAGGRKRATPTATLIDLNRTAQVRVGGAGGAGEAAILGLLPLLSREDIILEIPVGADRAWALGECMYKALRQGTGAVLEEQPWVRRLRLLVALLRDEHPAIDVSEVVPLMEAAHRRVRDENRDFIEASPTEASAVPVRMAVSFTRLVLASARAHDRSVAVEEDVDRAVALVRRKLDFLRQAVRLRVRVSECPGGRRGADEDFWSRRAGQTVSVVDLARAYQQETGAVVSPKTMGRELRRRGAKSTKHGLWQLPTAAQHAAEGTTGHADSETLADEPGLAGSTPL